MRKIRTRLLDLKLGKRRSAFLWGPRKVGKSYWLREHFDAGTVDFIDLLQTDVFAELAVRPALLRERWNGRVTVIDEVQKVPALLDEVHWLIENRKGQFILTGSSARNLRRGHANLLAGRAVRHELGPLCSREIDGFDLEAAMTSGLLPPHFLSTEPERDLRAYVADYLKEEIAAEGAVRNLPAFAEFLRAAALTNAELLNCANVARDCGISAKVVQGYFEILEDTLLGARLPPWRRAEASADQDRQVLFLRRWRRELPRAASAADRWSRVRQELRALRVDGDPELPPLRRARPRHLLLAHVDRAGGRLHPRRHGGRARMQSERADPRWRSAGLARARRGASGRPATRNFPGARPPSAHGRYRDRAVESLSRGALGGRAGEVTNARAIYTVSTFGRAPAATAMVRMSSGSDVTIASPRRSAPSTTTTSTMFSWRARPASTPT